MKNLTFSFDIGYSSIGWGVIESYNFSDKLPKIIGTGVVTFPPDTCLASKRREHRRTRRTIRARRKRIARIAKILTYHGIISEAEATQAGHPAPFLLAARALQQKQKLSPLETWQVIRWYAHNRGYDGNKSWSKAAESDEDISRVTMAKAKMAELHTDTMAETITAILNLNTDSTDAPYTVSSPKYRNLNLAFPRETVETELKTILTQASNIPGHVVQLITEPASTYKEKLKECGVRIPLRYNGSILFGQLLPRFDNRIIARCPITWAKTYKESIERGDSEAKAKQQADKYAKVPSANCAEFYAYRFARILANIRVNDAPIPAELRKTLMEKALVQGRFTKKEFSKLVSELTNNATNNLQNYFHLVPDADQALILIPQNDRQKASGRSPYARPVLKQVVEEILRGEDATKPMRSLMHPNGESKAHDGILFCLSDPDSEVNKIQMNRTIEQQTNNHLVRHRMLIFGRLLRDMISHYAQGDSSLVKTCCIEVNRNLKEFSGLTNKEISKKLNEQKKHFNEAKKYLSVHARELPLTAGLIRKCRIALDMNWTCPYTGMKYGALDLPKLDREHIIPYSTRNTNALSAQVLTYPEVNAMKGKRTAMEFVREFQGQEVPGRNNITICSEKNYRAFVDKLKISNVLDDRKRQTTRKKLLLVEKIPNKENAEAKLGFTDGQLTQSSQLMKLGIQVARKALTNARIIAIPGQITAEVRKSWKLMSIIAETIPDIIDSETNKIKEKEEIRNITHLHHAVDACTIGLIPHLIPGGDNGLVWKLLLQRHVNSADLEKAQKWFISGILSHKENGGLYLHDIPQQIKNSLSHCLAEKRVIRHIPADMSGASLDEQYKGIKLNAKASSSSQIILRSRDKKTGKFVTKEVNKSKVIGLQSPKLSSINSILQINENYGIALDPTPTIIRRVSVYKQIQNLVKSNGNKPIRILRTGQFIKLSNHKDASRNRIWMISSVKDNYNGIALDLQLPAFSVPASATYHSNWLNVKLASLLKQGMVLISNSYIGY